MERRGAKMDLKVIKQVSKSIRVEANFTDERDIKEALLKLKFFKDIPYVCGICHSENIDPLNIRKVKVKEGKNAGQEFMYVEAYCFDCKAKRQTGGALFWKKWIPFEEYSKEGNGGMMHDEE